MIKFCYIGLSNRQVGCIINVRADTSPRAPITALELRIITHFYYTSHTFKLMYVELYHKYGPHSKNFPHQLRI